MKDKKMIKYLKQKENIPKLEKLLEQQIEPKLQTEIDVFKEVNCFLRTNVGIPVIKTDGQISKYNFIKQEIGLRKNANLLDIAHEYAHHINFVVKGFSINSLYFEEGLARGVETYVAQKVGGEIQVENYVINHVEYLYTYLKLCKQLKEEPKKHLEKNFNMNMKFLELSNKQAIGNTVLSLYKSDYGDDVYWKMLHGKFKQGLFEKVFSLLRI